MEMIDVLQKLKEITNKSPEVKEDQSVYIVKSIPLPWSDLQRPSCRIENEL